MVVNHQENISRQTLFWLLLANVAIISPMFDKLTLWTAGICGICFLWRIGIYFGQVAKPPRYLVTLLAVGAAITLALVSKEIGALKALINLLILGYALKYIESRSQRDAKAIVLVGYFLIALTFIYHQGILNTTHLLINTLINTCVLLSLYLQGGQLKQTAQLGIKLVLLSLPLAILLFITIPRLPPLWMVPELKSAQTGLSSEVSFGDIGNLTRSDELAFRVTFDADVPVNGDLYWRTLVMENYDGKRWTRSDEIKTIEEKTLFSKLQRAGPSGPTIGYSIIAEPSHQHWLFALDLGFSTNQDIAELPDFRLYSAKPVDQKLQYRVTSAINQMLDPELTDNQQRINLALPNKINPRTRRLAQEFSRNYPEPLPRLQAMMRYFSNQAYFYTLRPPPVGPQQIDDFLFENKAGFCVHYASAFVFMARASGIPARMVAGYQGGELNPKAGYLSVYQYMAHAWTEVWLADRGWVRFDPTAMIAPDRILDGFDAFFNEEESLLITNPFNNLKIKQIPWLNELRLSLASVDYHWSLWVLGFDDKKQKQLLTELLGQITLLKVAIFMLSMLIIIGGMIAYSAGLIRLPQKQDPLDKRYKAIIKLFQKKNIIRHDAMGPTHFSEYVSKVLNNQLPSSHSNLISKLNGQGQDTHIPNQVAKDFALFSQHYVALKYQDLHQETRQKVWRLYLKQARKLKLSIFKMSPVDRDKSNT